MSQFVKQLPRFSCGRYEHITPILDCGDTSQCYIVTIKGKEYFLKMLAPDHESNPYYHFLFRKEYELSKKLDHPNIVKGIAFRDDDEGCCLLMEAVSSETLEKRLSTSPQYFTNGENIDNFFNELLSGFSYMHQNGIVYSDLNPRNVMISQIGDRVKIVDLGFCFCNGYSYTVGKTEAFAAPEQNEVENIDIATDIYCIGKLLEYIEQHTFGKLPRKYAYIKNKCLKTEKCDRFTSVDEIIDRINRKPLRKRAILTTIALVVSVVFALIGYKGYSPDEVPLTTDTITVENVKYAVFSPLDSTCEVVGGSIVADIYIKSTIIHKGVEYKVASIADSAFVNHTQLRSIYIAPTVKTIGQCAFRNCKNILSLEIPNSVVKIGANAFYANNSLKGLKLSSSVKTIPTACFAGFHASYLEVPEGVVNISFDAFAQNDSLRQVKLPESLITLERGVFFNCANLESIVIPANVNYVGEYIFHGCDKLVDIYNLSPAPQKITSIHRNPSQITLHVPPLSVEAYKSAYFWNKMKIRLLSSSLLPHGE